MCGLNENVLREAHPIPKVNETLAQLTGATRFSKLDANSGFWQIPLTQYSRLLTIFITPYGQCPGVVSTSNREDPRKSPWGPLFNARCHIWNKPK